MKASQSMAGDGGATPEFLVRAFATEAGTRSGTVETIAAQLLTFGRKAVRTPHGEV
jgi:hypothetical protein